MLSGFKRTFRFSRAYVSGGHLIGGYIIFLLSPNYFEARPNFADSRLNRNPLGLDLFFMPLVARKRH
jgi:hypothetical protein